MSRRGGQAACGALVAWLVVSSATAPPHPGEGAPAPGTVVPTDRDGFRLAVPPFRFEFPIDHAAHPSYRTEWWYYTGHLRAGSRRFGYELTFFRVALPGAAHGASAWRAHQVLFRHLALTDEAGRQFAFDDRAEREALDLAGADSTRYLVWVGDDYAGLEPDRTTHRLVGRASGFALDLELTPEKPAVVHGRDGVSQKSAGEGNASHYYSFTRLATHGRLVLGRDTLRVEGRSWMDHEFGSDQLRGRLAGWDWFGLQLSDGRDVMLYRMRTRGGGLDTCSGGTLIEPDGRARTIRYADFDSGPLGEWLSPHSGGRYPSGWRLRVPREGLELELTPTLRDQELVARSMAGIAYWEGSVRVRGSAGSHAVTGEGYVELTGYGGPSPFPAAGLDSLQRTR